MPLRLVSWNIQKRDEAWRELAAATTLDVALLQEAKPPPADVTCEFVPARDGAWTMAGYVKPFRAAVARLSDRVVIRARKTADFASLETGVLRVSVPGTLTVVDVEWAGEVFTCVSAYAPWQNVVTDAPKPGIISDAAAHRLISDISTLIAKKDHRIIVAGDFNVLRGYGEDGNKYWAGRYATVFARMDAIGLRCLGPAVPNGRQAEPWPNELPKDSKNVPTYHSSHQTPATAARQLDYVFASEGIADRISVRAMNGVDEWGPSDHCRVVIEVADA